MTRRPVLIKDKKKCIGSRSDRSVERDRQPPPEELLGGGDICSLEETPSTEDDRPLD